MCSPSVPRAKGFIGSAVLAMAWIALTFTMVSAPFISHAEVNRRGDYRFPYTNPYFATLTIRLLKSKALQPQMIEVPALPGREKIRFGDGRHHTPVAVFPQKKAAPLVYVIAGFGGAATEGSALWIGEFLAAKGFSVITLPSPLSWRFQLGQSSSGVPGYTPEDVKDLRRLMTEARIRAERAFKLKVTRVAVAGYSLGGAHAAFLMKLERESPGLGLERAVMINPPLHIPYAIERLDGLVAVGANWTSMQRDMIWGYVLNIGEAAIMRDINDPYYFYGLDIALKLSVDQTRYLIGSAFRQALSEVVLLSEEIAPSGLLKVPATTSRRAKRQAEALAIPFVTYMEKAVWNHWSKKLGNTWTLPEFVRDADLIALKGLLATDSAFRMVHNDDDFLIRPQDLESVADAMGDRAIVYPLGGHVGNLWNPENLEDLYTMVKDLL